MEVTQGKCGSWERRGTLCGFFRASWAKSQVKGGGMSLPAGHWVPPMPTLPPPLSAEVQGGRGKLGLVRKVKGSCSGQRHWPPLPLLWGSGGYNPITLAVWGGAFDPGSDIGSLGQFSRSLQPKLLGRQLGEPGTSKPCAFETFPRRGFEDVTSSF